MSEPDFSLRRDRTATNDRLAAYQDCRAQDPHRVEIIEWLLASTLVATGVHMLFFPEAVAISHMRLITSHVPSWVMASLGLWIGLTRLALLGGRKVSRRTFRLRAGLSGVGAIFWGEMVLAFAVRFWGQVPPPGFEMLLIMQFVGELWLVFRIKIHAGQLRRKGLIR